MGDEFLSVTEIAGDEVTEEQVERLCHRYNWAGNFCENKDVLEVACGTGQGLGYLSNIANNLVAGDYSDAILDIAVSHYKDRVELMQFDAQNMPFPDKSFDVVIIFEAIYYIPDTSRFVDECKRVLRPSGKILLATANKDLYDFNPSPRSYQYYGVVELTNLFSLYGFTSKCFGYMDIEKSNLKQKLLRPIKKIVVFLNLMPKSMNTKKLFKRLVFGELVKMPKEIKDNMFEYHAPVPLNSDIPDTTFKVIYCEATI